MRPEGEPNPIKPETPEQEVAPKRTETEASVERKELTPEEFRRFSKTTIETIVGGEFSGELEGNETEIKAAIEQAILDSIKGLPEELAKKLGTVDPAPLKERAGQLLSEIQQESDPQKRAGLQKELIFQHIALISRVQNGGDKGFIPSVAREVDGLDCSLSAWALKEKLASAGVPDLQYEFGYPSGHAVGIVSIADGRKLYVDAQNGFVSEIEVQQVQDEANPDTAYPIYEVTKSSRLSGNIPGEGEVALARPDGSDYLPKYLGIQESGLLHSIGNLHMLVSKESPTYNTETAARFRDALNNDPAEWEHFQQFVEKIAGGKVIQETEFEKQSQQHRNEYEIQKVKDKLNE